MVPFEVKMTRGGDAAIQEAGRFFMKQGAVHQSLSKIASRLDELGIPYAVVGGMALVAHGYERTTVHVDILVTEDGLRAIHQSLEGRGYVAPFAGSKQLRDAETSVRIEFLVSGQYPGDGRPKPVAFPDPAGVGIDIDGVRYLGLAPLIEIKLASGMTNPGRLRDLADVQELIRALNLPRDMTARLNPFVREQFEQLWDGVAGDRQVE